MTATSSPPPPENRVGKNWWGRNWMWFVPLGCLGMSLAGTAILVLIWVSFLTVFQNSSLFQEAMDRVRSHPRVVEELGEPIEAGWWVLGSFEFQAGSGNADMVIPISGPRNRGRIFLVAEQTRGTWHFEVLEVKLRGRVERIDLLEGEETIKKAGEGSIPATLRAALTAPHPV